MRSVGRRFGDPDGQEGLEPTPPPCRTVGFVGVDIVIIGVGAVLVFALMVIAIGLGRSELRRTEMRNAFMGGCIEHQTEDRCALLWRYGRQDLAK